MTGLFTHGAILAALYHRLRTGHGQKIDTSLFEAQVATLANIGSNYLIAGKPGRRWGSAHESIVPYQVFRTSNGHLVVAVTNDGQFRRLCQLIGHPTLADDPRYLNNRKRVENRVVLVATLQDIFKTKTTEEWLELVPWTEVCIGPINSIDQVFADPQVQSRRMVEEIDHPTAGKIKLAGFPVKYSEAPPTLRLPPPLLGEHTYAVLQQELGMNEAALKELESKGVIKGWKSA